MVDIILVRITSGSNHLPRLTDWALLPDMAGVVLARYASVKATADGEVEGQELLQWLYKEAARAGFGFPHGAFGEKNPGSNGILKGRESVFTGVDVRHHLFEFDVRLADSGFQSDPEGQK